ncbi:MAG: rubredoxin-like domain-containing protein [Candidatus Aenigmatarchaeota archaeon]
MTKKFFECQVCGDIHYGEAGPAICPTCGSEEAYEETEEIEAREAMGL